MTEAIHDKLDEQAQLEQAKTMLGTLYERFGSLKDNNGMVKVFIQDGRGGSVQLRITPEGLIDLTMTPVFRGKNSWGRLNPNGFDEGEFWDIFERMKNLNFGDYPSDAFAGEP